MSAMDAGVSGMIANQTRMDAVGNNIANSSTTGFKSTQILFGDELYQLLQAGSAPSPLLGGTDSVQVGQGVMVTSSETNFGQGNLTATGRTTDVAIEGQGFLTVTDGSKLYYTRNGSLGLDANGYLVHLASGLRVVALPANGNAPAGAGGASPPPVTPLPPAAGGTPAPLTVTPASTVQIPLGQTSIARATSQVAFGGNLDSRTAAGSKYQVTSRAYDSLGAGHDVTITFTRAAAANSWDVSATSTDGTLTFTAPSQVTFDANGAPIASTLSMQMALSGSTGANSPITMSLSLANVTQLAQENTAALRSQDGLPPGTLTGISINHDGSIQGVYTNGLMRGLGQLVTGQFANTQGLEGVRNSLYQASASSGAPTYGTPGSDGRGTIQSGQLESSNVNLAQEFSNMIVTERAFQANSRLVTTADQMLQDVINVAH